MTEIVKQRTMAIAAEKISIYTIVTIIFLAAAFYVYFANVTVRTLTVLEKTKKEMQELSVEVSDLEAKKLTLESGVDMTKAKTLGFVESKNFIFITKSSRNLSLR